MKKNNVEFERNMNLTTVKEVDIFVKILSYDILEDNYEGNCILSYYTKQVTVQFGVTNMPTYIYLGIGNEISDNYTYGHS